MKQHAKKPLKPIPTFRSDDEAGDFWMTHDTTEYLDWSKARRVSFPNLRPSTTTISLRLPKGLLDELRILANERDVPYQSLLKVFLAERVAKEHRAKESRAKGRPVYGARAPNQPAEARENFLTRE